jgi:translation initiation factor 3 subunit H
MSTTSANQLMQDPAIAAQLEVNEEPVCQVQLDALVIFKMIKHCREALPSLVTGQLLGLDVQDRLEITNCFPFPSRDTMEDSSDQDGAEYQIEMMRCLRLVNIDHNTAGWYQSTYFGSYINQSTVDTQFSYQEAIEKSVLIIYDPVRTDQGNLVLKALRLTPQFMMVYRERRFSIDR